jgi:UPF0176 protein
MHDLPPGDAAPPLTVAALYRFTRLADLADIREHLAEVSGANGIRGTLLLASEGINGTIAGTADAVAAVLHTIRAVPGCADLDVKLSQAATMPFDRMKVRIKREIVTMGEPDIDPATQAGGYVEPQQWNALIADPDVVVIDTRNAYEVAAGTFKGAVDPQTRTFRDFPAWFRANRDTLLPDGKPRKVAMFCTGGIRCEKSTAFLRQEGVAEVFHLKGGILKYLEVVPQEDSRWQGECFVFDQRVALGHGLTPGTHAMCRACGSPVGVEAECSACLSSNAANCHAA